MKKVSVKYILLTMVGILTPFCAWLVFHSYESPSEVPTEIYSDHLDELQLLEGKRVHLNGFCVPDNIYYYQSGSFAFKIAPVYKCGMGRRFCSSRLFLTVECQEPYSLAEKWQRLEKDTLKLFTGLLVRERYPVEEAKELMMSGGICMDDKWCFQVLVDYNPWDNIFYAGFFYLLIPAGCVLAMIIEAFRDRKRKAGAA